jgi:hypothetical protein
MDGSRRMPTRDDGGDASFEGSIVVDDHRKEPRGSKTQTQSVQWQFTCLGSCHGPCLCVSISET